MHRAAMIVGAEGVVVEAEPPCQIPGVQLEQAEVPVQVAEQAAAAVVERQPLAHEGDAAVALAYAVAGDEAELEAWIQAIEELVEAGRYPSGCTIPAVARAFAAFQRKDYAATIDLIVPMLPDRERIGGSRAQVDLLEATLLRAYLDSGRVAEAERLVANRRPGPASLPVAGLG